MNKSSLQYVLSGIFLVLGFIAVFGLSNYLERNRVSLPEAYQDEDLTLQGKRLKGYVLGAEGLIADWYWMQSLQYLGSKIIGSKNESFDLGDLRPLNPRLLYPYLDNSTELDPKLMAAYTFGATILPAIDTSKAIDLTEKGIANNPDSWNLYHLLGYIHWRNKDYEKAAQAYDTGMKLPGAPSFMRIMAASMRTQGGSRETARVMYKQMLESDPDAQTKTNAEFRLKELDALDDLDALNASLKTFTERQGRCASGWSELLPLLQNVKLPEGRDFLIDSSDSVVDPTGIPYSIDRSTCKAQIGPESTLPPS